MFCLFRSLHAGYRWLLTHHLILNYRRNICRFPGNGKKNTETEPFITFRQELPVYLTTKPVKSLLRNFFSSSGFTFTL